MKTILCSAALSAFLFSCGGPLEQATDDPPSHLESELSTNKFKRLLRNVHDQTASFGEVASLLPGAWVERSGPGLRFDKATSAGELAYTQTVSLPDIDLLVKGYGQSGVDTIFTKQYQAELKALTNDDFISSGGDPVTRTIPVSGSAHIAAPLPWAGYELVLVAPRGSPAALVTALSKNSVSFDSSSTFSHPYTPCLKSHSTTGGMVCDEYGPTVTLPGTGVVTLWYSASGGQASGWVSSTFTHRYF